MSTRPPARTTRPTKPIIVSSFVPKIIVCHSSTTSAGLGVIEAYETDTAASFQGRRLATALTGSSTARTRYDP